MDPYLRSSWKRLLRVLSFYYFLIYQAHLSWGVERVNVSEWDELNNSGSRSIKQQKWDTASQGGQDLQTMADGLESNTSSSSHSSVSQTLVTYNLTSSSTERTLSPSWTLSSVQSSATTADSHQTPSRTLSSRQSPGYTPSPRKSTTIKTSANQSQGSTPASESTSTAPSSQLPTIIPISQSSQSTSPRDTEVFSQSVTSTSSARQEPGSTQASQSPKTTTLLSQLTTLDSQSPGSTTPGKIGVPSQSSTTPISKSKLLSNTTPGSKSPATVVPLEQSSTTIAPVTPSASVTPSIQSSIKIEARAVAVSQSPSRTTATPQRTPSSRKALGITTGTQKPTSIAPATQSATSAVKSNHSPNKLSLTSTIASQLQATPTPGSESPATPKPDSESPTTPTPASKSPPTPTPGSESPTTPTPASESPTTPTPGSESPTTPTPASESPTTPTPASESPTTPTPASESPTTPTPAREPQTTTTPAREPQTIRPFSQTPTTPVSKLPITTRPAIVSYSITSHNTSQSNVKPPDQSLTSSGLPNHLSSGLLSPVSGSFSPEEHPVNNSLLTRQVKEALRLSLRRSPAEQCMSPCLNGGQCIQSDTCDCSLYQATGHRCQTVPNPGFEREMTCRTWGQYNFETFDGLYFFFPGRCTYTLLKDCEESTQASIVVQVHNDPDCGSVPYTCQRSVSLFLPWEGEVRLDATSVTYNGQRLQLPHHIHDLQLEQISQYVLVTLHHSFTLAWEGRSGSVYIKLSPDFVGRTCGLCGNFNADVQDDLKTSYGVLTNEIEMFGNSWVETAPHQDQCARVPSDFSSPCAAVDAHVLLKVEEVCAMLLDPPFQSCHDFVSPLSYMASCSNDLCMSGPSGDVVCQVFTEYARACAHADHPLHHWRQHIPQCAKQCPLGLQYRECISCCPQSCNIERTCIDSKLACLDGCYCPNGLIYEDGGCVMPSDCPCEYHGMFYPSGQTLQEECNNCTCVGGVWNCTDYSCPGECSVTGDMYFHSFDGRLYTFPARCQYVLAKSRNSGKFTVTIQNAPCGANLDGACIQSVNLVIDEDPKTEITLSHVGEVFMAGQYRISLPYSDDVFHIQELSSMFLQVKTTFGLRLQYSWKEFRLYLQADERWKDNTVGLCGTFNGNIQDDFLSPSGMIESTPQLFGNAWRVLSACSTSLSTPQLDPCDTHQQAVAYASSMCDILNQDLFSACHEYLSPTPFHQQCRSDTCKCGTPCLCSALAHYARHCRRFSVIIDFRAHIPDCAVTCSANMQYGTCVSSCQSRCSALSVPQHCGEECEEGCVCPQGSFYNHRTHTCVHRSECPCSILGADYEPGDVIMTSAGVQLCLNGKLVSQTTDSDRLCPAGQLYQNCSEGEDDLLPGRGVACERTCESYLLNLTCSTHEPCVTGCTCPPGLLKHGDECFEPVACPCLWKGKEYYPGDRVSSPCHECVCQHGTFQCVFRPCPSMCTAYADRHYRTFDGLLFDYVGACKVYLLKSSEGVMLSVTAENVDCFDSGVICRKSLAIAIGRSFIAFDDDTGKPNPSSVIDRKQRMFMWPAGYFTVIHFPEDDVTILWDRKTTIHIQVGPRWQGKLSGLCGNYDLKTVNEMRTPDNIDSSTPQEFGNSWTAAECVNSPDIRHPCSLSPLREPFAKRRCAVLLTEVFQACHPVVDVTWFYMNCLADTCACSRGGDCECFCTSVAAYAQRCCHQGVPVDWRSPSLCPYDCEFFNKVLGKGPFRLIPFRDRSTVLAANRSGGSVFLQRVNMSTSTTSIISSSSSSIISSSILSQFMMTPGLSRARPHDTSRVSFEAVHRPNFFLYASPSGQVRLAKWEESDAFWDGATFVLHRNTWIPGYDSLESHAKPGFFLHATLPRLHLLKYRHADIFRKATLFRLTGSSSEVPPHPVCQWRYDSCVSPCFKTCSDPSAEACVTIPQVEGCLPVCPPHMVLDEVTHRCVHVEDCIKAPVVVQPSTSSTAQSTSASTTSTTTSTTASSTLLKTTVTTESSASPHTSPTTKLTTAPPGISTQATSTTPPAPSDEPTRPVTATFSSPPELSKTLGPLSSPTAPPLVQPEQLSTAKVTENPPTTTTATTAWMPGTGVTISPIGRSTPKMTSTPFAITALFLSTTSTKPADSLTTTVTTRQTALTTTSTEGPTTTSAPHPVLVHPTKETTEATTPSAAVTPTVAASSSGAGLISETSKVTDTTIVPSTTTSAYTDTSTKTVTVERLSSTTTTPVPPGLLSATLTTASPLPTMPPVETGTVSLPTATSLKTTASVTLIAPFSTSKTTPYMSQETTAPASTSEKSLYTTSTILTTSTTSVPEETTSTQHDVAPTTAWSSAATAWRTTTKKVDVPESSVSEISAAATTTTAALPETTDTTTTPVSISTTYIESTSWSAAVPTTERTTQTFPRPSEVSRVSTTSTGRPVTTKQIALPESHTETTTVSLTPTTESFTRPPATTRTSESWRPPHQDTSSTPVYTSSVTTPAVTSEIHVPSSTTITEVPHPPVTATKQLVTSATSVSSTASTAPTTTFYKILTAGIGATVSSKLVTPPPPEPGAPETHLTTAATKAPPAIVTTTLRPVVIQPLTEATHPVTGRVEVSTRATTTPPPSWSPLHTTTVAAPRPMTLPEKVTTRLVSTIRATPASATATVTRTTALRTTPRVAVTTRVTPRVTVTERSTIRPIPARVTVASRPSTVFTRSTTPHLPVVTSSTSTTTTPGAPSVTVQTSPDTVTTVSTTEHTASIIAVPDLTTVTAPVPVPSLMTATASTAIPTTTSRETVTSERTLATKETDVSPSTPQLVTSPPEISTHEHGIPSPAVTPHPTTTTVQTTEPLVDQSSPGATIPSVTTSPHAPVETTRHTAKDTTSVAVSPTGMCAPPYAEIVDECTKYICVNNQLVLFNKSQSCPFTSEPPNCGLLGFAVQVNGDKCCPQWDCPCRCSMFPDLNVITFDGNSVAVYKAASYIVTQLPNETVSVLVQECPADSESPLLWNFTNLCLVALNITHKSNHIVINRLQRRLYVNTRYAKPRFKKYGFEIYDTGNMYLIRSPAGLRLQWYHSTGMMVIDTDSSSNKLSTMGLCGFCDGDPTNDLTLANGTTVGVSEDPAVFIDSWQVPNTTSYISQSRRRELNCSTSDCSSCLAMLHHRNFSPCHAFVPPSTFCEVWIRDAEYVNNQCVALAAYVASCHKFNICIEWRSPEYCPFVCPNTLRYQACLPACTSQSCPNHDFDSDPDQCTSLTEGCVCPEGTLLHRPYSALCVSPDKCACTDSSGVPHANGEMWKASKDACCMYRCDKETIVPVEYNCSSVAVPVCSRAGEVVISLADDTSCCPQKVCVCNQSLCDLPPPACKYGEKLVSYYKQESCCPHFVCECDSELCESNVPICRDDQILIATRADSSCCLAHICMCSSSCPAKPSLCQDGEVLTIDGNTTDRCCPTYQCVCEPYRCPQLSCPVGMAVLSVAVPGRCCPNQTCECSCEKIASPKCDLGEAAQLDRAFMSDPQNQCACKRYKCVREAVCVFGEWGVLRPGQTLVEHGDDGLCHSRQCSRSLDQASGFHLLRTSSINCSTHCQPNQIYIPPKDQSTCCGVCKNISCLYEHENGTAALYKPGKSWVSNCLKFDCTDTLSGPTLISYSFSCPPFNETECVKVGGTIVSYMDGCCKTCKEDGKSCQKVTVRMTIRKNDCRSNRPVNIVSCDGKCPSASIYNYNINTYARFCKCCRETGLQRRSVQLYCSSNATWVSYTIQEPTDCSCQWS
ncbi:otogelin isoform X3 [Solea solea]|uniref:otogelin isoform X3 n=1 Tax=Solea solea TaxID=90069 RepID=UPI00272D27A0|nr:otogelin isoform X3 [Solea solea]